MIIILMFYSINFASQFNFVMSIRSELKGTDRVSTFARISTPKQFGIMYSLVHCACWY